MISRSSRAKVPSASCITILDSTKTSMIEQGLFNINKVREMCASIQDNHLCDELGTHEGVSGPEADTLEI